MKTSNELETELTESSINIRLNHKAFLTHTENSAFTSSTRNVRNVDKDSQAMLLLLGIEEYTAQSKISLHPEFVAYAFHLYGLSRKLFMYIIFFELNNDTCRFIFDKAMMNRFQEFCFLFGEEEKDSTIQQAVRTLIRKNIMISVDLDKYMLNPLIAGGANEKKRRKLIDSYSLLLEKKGLDASVHFYPKYQHTV